MKQIPLTKGLVALVDDADYELVSRFKWHAHVSGVKLYAARTEYLGMVEGKKKQRMIYLHHFVLQVDSAQEIDHRDNDGLNNQRSNLRPCTRSQNLCNSKNRTSRSGFRGVYAHATTKKWEARVRINGKPESLGLFETPEAAHQAYIEAASEHYGEFARTQ